MPQAWAPPATQLVVVEVGAKFSFNCLVGKLSSAEEGGRLAASGFSVARVSAGSGGVLVNEGSGSFAIALSPIESVRVSAIILLITVAIFICFFIRDSPFCRRDKACLVSTY